MKTIMVIVQIFSIILIYELIKKLYKTEAVQQILGGVFFLCILLSTDTAIIPVFLLALFFLLVHQFIAAIFFGVFFLVGLICRLTNGFGATWG